MEKRKLFYLTANAIYHRIVKVTDACARINIHQNQTQKHLHTNNGGFNSHKKNLVFNLTKYSAVDLYYYEWILLRRLCFNRW